MTKRYELRRKYTVLIFAVLSSFCNPFAEPSPRSILTSYCYIAITCAVTRYFTLLRATDMNRIWFHHRFFPTPVLNDAFARRTLIRLPLLISALFTSDLSCDAFLFSFQTLLENLPCQSCENGEKAWADLYYSDWCKKHVRMCFVCFIRNASKISGVLQTPKMPVVWASNHFWY